MKSKLFKDIREPISTYDICAPDKLVVCVRLNKRVYEHVLAEANRLGVSSGEYVERLVLRETGALPRLH